MEEIKLGDIVRCIHTGFVGTVVCKSEFINGCVQFAVLPKINKRSKSFVEGTMPEEVGIDSQSLEVIKPKREVVKKNESNGGAMTRGLKSRGF